MRCDNCGREGALERRVTRTYGEDADLLVIENVPVVTCPSCGESYMTAATLHHLEDLRDRGRGVAVARPVGVVQFDMA
jgi:YgiT-type zinc finger domain-containing protein